MTTYRNKIIQSERFHSVRSSNSNFDGALTRLKSNHFLHYLHNSLQPHSFHSFYFISTTPCPNRLSPSSYRRIIAKRYQSLGEFRKLSVPSVPCPSNDTVQRRRAKSLTQLAPRMLGADRDERAGSPARVDFNKPEAYCVSVRVFDRRARIRTLSERKGNANARCSPRQRRRQRNDRGCRRGGVIGVGAGKRTGASGAALLQCRWLRAASETLLFYFSLLQVHRVLPTSRGALKVPVSCYHREPGYMSPL